MSAERWANVFVVGAIALAPLASLATNLAYANDAAAASDELDEAAETPQADFPLLDGPEPLPPAEELPAELLPPVAPAPSGTFDSNSITAESLLEEGRIVSLTDDASLGEAVDADGVPLNDLFYNASWNSTNWIIGHDDRFGMVNLESSMSLASQEMDGIVGGVDFHFLDGPIQTEMPPRLFDLAIGYGRRRWITSNVGYDILARVGVYTDFEGSARKGVRFPGHAVAQIRVTPQREWLLGVEVLDRDDVSLLPVIGPRWRPNGDWELDLVFPRPKIAVRLPRKNHWAYVRGELGGGTWAIERDNSTDDNATYRDVRLVGGWEWRSGDVNGSLEVAYVFARDLSYRSGIGDMSLEDAVMIGFTGRY